MTAKGKTVLIVYAHHYDKSLNAAILDSTVETLKADGCDVIISDLYAQGFNPLIGLHDFKGGSSTENYNYCRESKKAYNSNNLVDDIVAEQVKLSKADLVIFQFPMQWFSVPAILKGWFDRVITEGFAFDVPSASLFDRGLFKGKKAMLSFTCASALSFFTPEGINGDINVVLYPIHRGILQFCGFDVLQHHVIGGTDFLDKEMGENQIHAWKKRISNLWTEDCIPAIPMHQFDFKNGGVLREDSVHRAGETAPTVGIHCGKPIV